MTKTLSLLAAMLLESAAAADESDKLFKQKINCDRYVTDDYGVKKEEPGLLSFKKMGLCRERNPPWAESPCAAGPGLCGMRPEWDDRLQIWRPYPNPKR